MRNFKLFIPQIILFLLMTTLCMTYFVDNVVFFQNIIYLLVLVLYIIAPKYKIDGHNSTFYKILLLFVVLYIFRAFVELELLGHRQLLYGSNSTVYYFMFNGMILPVIFATRLKIEDKSIYIFFFLGLLIAGSLLISLYNILSGNIIYTVDQRIQANERLGVIQYGHLGLTSVILGIVLYLNEKYHKLFKYASVLFVLIGLISMLMSGTRGALISLFFIVALYVFAKAKSRTFIIVLLGIGVLYILFENMTDFLDSIGASSATRIFRLFSEGGDQSSGRTEIWLSAIGEIFESPLLGVSCFLHSHDADITYVHNSFIEVSYTLGLFGLYVFARANYIAIKQSISIMRSNNHTMMAFSFLYIQYLTFSIFSESVIRMPLYWFFLCIILNYNFNERRYANNSI